MNKNASLLSLTFKKKKRSPSNVTSFDPQSMNPFSKEVKIESIFFFKKKKKKKQKQKPQIFTFKNLSFIKTMETIFLILSKLWKPSFLKIIYQKLVLNHKLYFLKMHKNLLLFFLLLSQNPSSLISLYVLSSKPPFSTNYIKRANGSSYSPFGLFNLCLL